jgi:DNA (cytosine-5)-methyltransferase 1
MKVNGIKELDQIGTTVSLYCGAGGLDIGFHLAGFHSIWANDIDRFAINTYQTLFENNTATVGDILEQKLPKKKVDLVIGGPPCQGFSVAGKMDPNDPRSKHVWNFLGVVNDLKPRGFVMENVKALAINSRWNGLLENLTKEAEKMGYKTKLLVLNASDFGVPQLRERMFLIGLKSQAVKDPRPTTLKNKPTVKGAFKNLPKVGEKGNDSVCTAKITPAKNPILRKSAFAGMLFNGQGRPLHIDKPSLTLPASMGGNRTPIIDQNQLEFDSQPWVIKYHRHLTNGGKPYKKVPEFLRRMTVEEAAAVQTFPIGMKFSGTHSNKYKQIGNAVPPMLAYHVAVAIRNTFENL